MSCRFRNPIPILIFVLACLGLGTCDAGAATYTWTGLALLSTDWTQARNWSPAAVPGPNDTAVIGALKIVTVPSDVTIAGLSAGLASTISGAGNITVTRSCTVSDAILAGPGSLNIGSGAVMNVNDLLLATVGTVLNRPINNSGTLTIKTLLSLTVGANINNISGGVLDIQSDVALSLALGTSPSLTNAGTFKKSAGLGVALLPLSCTNSGVIDLQSGTLKFAAGLTQNDGSTNLNGGNLAAARPINILGGLLAGTGTIKGDVNNSAHVGPGHSPGTITINGNYTQTANGSLDMELAGTTAGSQYDQLIVEGTATLDGTLKVSLLNGYVPVAGNSFYLIQYYGFAGKFKTLSGMALNGGKYLSAASTPSYFLVQAKTDTVAPAAPGFTKPVAGTTVTALSTLSGTATDNSGGSGIVRVDLYIRKNATNTFWNGTGWTASAVAITSTVSGNASTGWTWTRSNGAATPMPSGTLLPKGVYTLTATSWDLAGNHAANSITVTVNATAAGAPMAATTSPSSYSS